MVGCFIRLAKRIQKHRLRKKRSDMSEAKLLGEVDPAVIGRIGQVPAPIDKIPPRRVNAWIARLRLQESGGKTEFAISSTLLKSCTTRWLSRFPSRPIHPMSTRFRPTNNRRILEIVNWNAASRASSAGMPWRWWFERTKNVWIWGSRRSH